MCDRLEWNRRYIALVAAAAVSLPFGIVVAFITVDGMKEKLYPAVAGVPSHYHGLAASRRRVALVVFGGLVVSAAAIAFLLATKNSSSLLSFLLLLYTVGVATGASPPTEEAEPGRASADAVQALAEAFKASGYEVVPHPQTGEPEVDPLLVELDLFAHKGERGLAIQIKQGSRTSEPLTWTDASRLATAAQVLEFDLPAFRPADLDQAELPSFVERVQPVLVLVDVDADQSLLTFCRAERVTVFNIRTAERSAGIIDRDQSDLAEVAEYYAALLAAERPAQASRAEVAAV